MGQPSTSCRVRPPETSSIEMMEAGKGSLRFKHDHGAYWTVNDKVPELSTGYEEGYVEEGYVEEGYVKELFERHGLSLEDGMYYGGWCGRPDLWGDGAGDLGDQDLLLSAKVARPVAP